MSPGDLYVAEVSLEAFGPDAKPIPEQREEDARLIAAAPELLEALKEVPAWFEEWSVEIGPAEQALLDRVNEAIAKAEGHH